LAEECRFGDGLFTGIRLSPWRNDTKFRTSSKSIGWKTMTTEDNITREETETKGRYVYREAGSPDAEMTFSKAGQTMIIIDHTEVPDAYRGQGVGLMLVQRAVDDARKSGRKIIPLCPFAAAQFRRHPEWSDVKS
jgi:hypothetical protein